MVNRYYNRRPLEGQLYTPNLDMISKALESTQKKYDTNFQLAQTIKNRYVESLQQDRKAADQLQQETQQKIDSIVKGYSGDYSRASKDLSSLMGEINKQYQPGGKAHAITYMLNQQRENAKSNQERLAKGDITSQQITAQNNWFNSSYTGVGEKNPETGNYNYLNIDPLAQYVDASKLADEATKGLKPRKKSVTESVREGNNWREITREVESVDPGEVAAAIRGSMKDGKYQNYATQLAKYSGADPVEYMTNEYRAQLQTYGPARSGVFSEVDKNLFKGMDEEAKMRMQFAHDIDMEKRRQAGRKAMADYKKQLDTEPDNNVDHIGLLSLNKAVTNTFDKIDLYSGQGMTSDKQTITSTVVGTGLFGPLGAAASVLGLSKSPPVKNSYQSIMNDDTGKYNVNKSLLEAIKQANPNLGDKEIFTKYNASLDRQQNTGSGIFYTPYTIPEQQKQAADVAVSQAVASGARIYKLGSDGTVSTISNKDFQEKAVLDPKTRKTSLVALGRTKGFSGDVPKGTALTNGTETFVIEDNDQRMRQYNGTEGIKGDREKAFGFVFKGGSKGDPFPMPTEKGPLLSIGVRSYKLDDNGDVIPDYKFYRYKYDAFMGKDIVDYTDPWKNPDGSFMDPNAIEQQMLGSYENTMRAKQSISKSKEEPQDFNEIN